MLERLTRWWRERRRATQALVLEDLKARYHALRVFQENNARALEIIGLVDAALAAGDDEAVGRLLDESFAVCAELVDGLNMLSGGGHERYYATHQRLFAAVAEARGGLDAAGARLPLVLPLDAVQPGQARQVGTKAANLAELRAMGLPVPDGFAVTTRACRDFLEQAGLAGEIRSRLDALRTDPDAAPDVAADIGRAIAAAPLPGPLSQALDEAWAALAASGPLALSARSSAVAEDRADHSFAGQFSSVLNVTDPEALGAAYRRVVASCFGARALAYRLRAGLPLTDFDMAVLCQRMVDARCAGICMTTDPTAPDRGRMLVSAVPGLGTLAVGGEAPADVYHPARDGGRLFHAEALVADKTDAEVAAPGGGLTRAPVPEAERRAPLLSRAELAELVRLARRIENLEGAPQDIEWAFDRQGAPRILQARPLRLAAVPAGGARLRAEGAVLAPGLCASPGKAVGRVLTVRDAAELEAARADGPQPRILLLSQSVVDAARRLCDFAGLIVDVGNPADHLSCIAREYAVPMVTGTMTAARDVPDGAWVVLDADRGRVHEAPPDIWAPGEAEAPARERCAPRAQGDPRREALRALVVPLNLTDAYGATFSPLECRSLHDLVRLLHENAVLAMFNAGDGVMDQAGSLLRRLDIGVPFHFLAIDLGGAFLGAPARGALGPQDVTSRPLAALIRGLTTPGLSWHSAPPVGALAGLLSRTMLDKGGARPAGEFNYALAARDYLNLNARMEFHFAMLDAVCGPMAPANYARFRFKGGGTGAERCRRRTAFIAQVLTARGFTCALAGDLISAQLVGAPRPAMEEHLEMLGRLLGYSRLLDAQMNDDEAPARYAKAFLDGRWDDRELNSPENQA